MLDCKGNKINFGDLINIQQDNAEKQCIYIRTIGKNKPFPEFKPKAVAGKELIYSINKDGSCCAAGINISRFELIKSVRGKSINPEYKKVSDYSIGDCIGVDKKPTSKTFCVLMKIAQPGENLKHFGISMQHKEKAIIGFVNTFGNGVNYVYYPVDADLYRYHSFFSSDTQKVTTLDTSMYNTVCSCGKPAYQGFIGGPECSDPNCELFNR